MESPQIIDFENPDKKPLGELFFYLKEDGVQLKIPALNKRWVRKKNFIKYRSLTSVGGEVISGADLDEWLTDAEAFKTDMEYLLDLDHFRFWSHLVFEPSCIEAIISFLQEATPYYLNLPTLIHQPKVILLYSDILQYVLRVICRMITNKESDEEWITKEHLKELLYSKYLLSIPMIFDMFTAYGMSNINVLSKIIQTIFKIEPKYREDLRIGIQYLQKVFKVIQQKTENEGMGNDNEPVSSFDDLALYTMDCSCTLSILLEAFPDARSLCSEIHLEQSITNFYDNTISLLYKNIFTINPSSPSLKHLNRSRIELLKAFRALINLILEQILNNPNENILEAEKYIAILTECLTDRTFVADYQKFFPVESDIDIIRQACKDLDDFKADFILNAYTNEEASYLVDLGEYNGAEDQEEFDVATTGLENELQDLKIDLPGRDIASEVAEVQDILPHLGDGFIRKLLERYNDTAEAVTAVLEGNLPPDLAEADQSEIYVPPDPKDSLYRSIGISRNNVFDGDDYDIMTHDNPKCIIKSQKGFPGQPKNMEELLNDKTHVKEMKEKYQEYSLVSEDVYDDEYDDSYEALADTKTARLKIAKNVIVNEILDEELEDDEESEEEEVEEKNEKDKSKEYLENPADIRARNEAARNAKFSSRGGNRDVVGKPKGQGQKKDVLVNRQKKEANKSSRANHSRKSGAAWKRSRGMMPF